MSFHFWQRPPFAECRPAAKRSLVIVSGPLWSPANNHPGCCDSQVCHLESGMTKVQPAWRQNFADQHSGKSEVVGVFALAGGLAR